MSQSFGKSFPEINEDAKEEDGDLLAADLFPEDRMRASKSFTAAPAPGPAPAKPKRSMVTSYSNINLSSPRAVQPQPAPGQGGTSSVRARVRMFESMSSSSARVQGSTKQSASLAPPPATRATAVEKKERRGGGGSRGDLFLPPDAAGCFSSIRFRFALPLRSARILLTTEQRIEVLVETCRQCSENLLLYND